MAVRDVPWGQTHRHGCSRRAVGSDSPTCLIEPRLFWGDRRALPGAEIRPVEPAPGHAGEGSALTPNGTPSWGFDRVPERRPGLGLVDVLLLWSSLAVWLLGIVE